MKSFVALNVTPVARNGPKSRQMSENQTAGERASIIDKVGLEKRWLLSVAPMMDWTD